MHVSAGRVHLHRLARDVDADGAAEAVRIPIEHVALGIAARDEARIVRFVTLATTAAVARHVAEDLWVLRGEVIGRADDVHWANRREADGRQRRHALAHHGGLGAWGLGLGRRRLRLHRWTNGGGFLGGSLGRRKRR
jgi:hypothetical protein